MFSKSVVAAHSVGKKDNLSRYGDHCIYTGGRFLTVVLYSGGLPREKLTLGLSLGLLWYLYVSIDVFPRPQASLSLKCSSTLHESAVV